MTHTFEQLLATPGIFAGRELPNGNVVCLRSLLFGSVEICLSTPEDLALGIVSDGWQYNPGYFEDLQFVEAGQKLAATLSRAWAAFDVWDGEGEPLGWTRHVATGRRRYNGDPDRELVRP